MKAFRSKLAFGFLLALLTLGLYGWSGAASAQISCEGNGYISRKFPNPRYQDGAIAVCDWGDANFFAIKSYYFTSDGINYYLAYMANQDGSYSASYFNQVGDVDLSFRYDHFSPDYFNVAFLSPPGPGWSYVFVTTYNAYTGENGFTGYSSGYFYVP